MIALLFSMAWAGEIAEDRRIYADETVQERWTWEAEKTPDALLRKEWFHKNGERSRLEEYAAGQLQGRLATWDARGVLLVEEAYVAGQLHGAQKTWSGSESDRWVEVELNYEDGVPHGPQLRRSDKDTIELRHNYQHGQLHGRQQAWQPYGDMRYDLNFVEGQLDGEQRFWDDNALEPETWLHAKQGKLDGRQRMYIDQGWQDEVWVDGLFEKVTGTHDDGTPRAVEIHELDLRPMDRPYDGGSPGDIRPDQPLSFVPSRHRLAVRTHHPNGTVAVLHETVGDRHYQAWADNGQLILEGDGAPHQRVGTWTEWRTDGTLWREEAWTKDRVGERRVYDAEGRLRETETWNWELQRLYVVLYDGDQKRAEGDLSTHGRGLRDGEWTYFWPDGTVRRTEQYGPGPYSGNRPYVVESEELYPNGRLRCEGDERDLRCLLPLDEGGRQELKVIALNRPRHGFESYDRETMAFVQRDIPSKVLADDAVVIAVLDGRGLVLERRTVDADGAEVSVERWTKEGEPTP